MRISLEGKVLLVIVFLDCIISAVSIHLGIAFERNPIVNLLLQQGFLVFFVSKIAISLVLISALELFRYRWPHKRRYIRSCQWIAVIGYFTLFGLANLTYLIPT